MRYIETYRYHTSIDGTHLGQCVKAFSECSHCEGKVLFDLLGALFENTPGLWLQVCTSSVEFTSGYIQVNCSINGRLG